MYAVSTIRENIYRSDVQFTFELYRLFQMFTGPELQTKLHILNTVLLLDTLIMISPKIDAPYLWIPVITLHLSIVAKKHSIATITKLRSLELLIKTPLLHILYYINGLTHDFWTRTGGWEFDRSHGAGTSSPSHGQQVEEQAPKPVDWTMCFLLMTLVPVQKLCVNIYVYICTFLIRVLL